MPAVAIDAAITSDSSFSSDATALYAAASGLGADSSVFANLIDHDSDSATIIATSSFTATLHIADSLLGPLLGNSSFVISPGGVTITHFAVASQIPATAKPATVPQLRITPPSPARPAYSVSTTPPRKKT